MTSLSEVYEGGVGSVVDRQRRLVGVSLFAVGVALVVGAIPLATTEIGAWVGYSVYEARELAGVMAGLGLPAVFVGIFTVLPASGPTRAAASIGASIAVLGVAMFSYAYPYNWMANTPELAIATTVVYSTGTLLTFWCLFIGVATFKTRNKPGGTARLEITDEGKVRVVSTGGSIPGFGSVGLFGRGPDGTVPTQTNETETPEPTTQSNQASDSHGDILVPKPAADGAGAIADSADVSDEVVQAARTRGRPDEYCGNCASFEYVRANGEMAPYCGFHEELMEDMEACDQWQVNN